MIGPGDAKHVMAQIGQFRRIRTLTLGRDPSLSDADLVHLKGMADLGALYFDKGKITGAGLENIAGLPKLHRLRLQGIPLRDDDLRPLEALTNPDTLTLDSPRITDAGLVHLKHLVPLRFLSLNETGVTGAGLGNLADMSNLEILYLVKTKVSSLQSIRHLPKLRWLDLTDTPLDDAGVAALADPGSFPSLAIFGASNTRLTDTGLRSLRGRSSLERLFLDGTRITDSGMMALGKMPSISILGVGRTSLTDAGLGSLEPISPQAYPSRCLPDGSLRRRSRSPGSVSGARLPRIVSDGSHRCRLEVSDRTEEPQVFEGRQDGSDRSWSRHAARCHPQVEGDSMRSPMTPERYYGVLHRA